MRISPGGVSHFFQLCNTLRYILGRRSHFIQQKHVFCMLGNNAVTKNMEFGGQKNPKDGKKNANVLRHGKNLLQAKELF